MFVNSYIDLFEGDDNWKNISTSQSEFFNWEDSSTYIQPSPFFTTQNDSENKLEEITDAYPLLVLGDSVTTDHISPAGSFKESTPAGTYLVDQGTSVLDFNSYGSRRGNFKIMQRGTFANIRIANKLVPDKTGGYTKHIPTNKIVSVYEASELYKNEDRELIVIAGKNYGCGSSRDWAAKGTKLLGVKAVIAESFERIHRSNLVGMGVLPLEFIKGENYESLGIDNNSTFTIAALKRNDTNVNIHSTKNGQPYTFKAKVRIDTDKEWDYFLNDGILNYVLKNISNST